MKLCLSFPLLVLIFLMFAAPSAQAQSGWVIDHYECTGATIVNGYSTPWPLSTSSVNFATSGGTVQCVGTVRAVFRWTGPGSVPATLNALVTSLAQTNSYSSSPAPDDGFHDPAPTGGYTTTSQGSHIVQVANPNLSVTVKVPADGQAAYSLSAITSGYTVVSFKATTTNAFLQGYSTHVSPALTGSEPLFSAWNPSNPRYFSGTGCEAKAIAVPLSGYLTHVQLCVNDTVVEEYWDSAAAGKPSPLPTGGSVVTGTSLTSATVKALFDSTHFADSSPITIKMKVTDSNSGYYEATVAAIAKNRAYILANQERDPQNTQSTYAANAFSGMNYVTLGTSQDHKTDVLQRLPHNTAFFTITHGNQSDFTDSYYSPAPNAQYDPNVSVEWQDISQALKPENPTDPSFNPDLAPYNFVYLDACETAGFTSQPINYNLANSFGIYQSNHDRAFLGWHNEVFNSVYDFRTWNERLWNDLINGRTILDAVLKSCIDGQPQGELVHGVEVSNDVKPVIIGDGRLKLHGVYLGIDASQWFRPI